MTSSFRGEISSGVAKCRKFSIHHSQKSHTRWLHAKTAVGMRVKFGCEV